MFNFKDSLPEQFTINVDDIKQSLINVIVNKGVGPDNMYA